MKILLTNDDGYKAEGLNTLAKVLRSHGHEVFVFSTSRDASGYGNALTITHKLRMKQKQTKWGHPVFVLEQATTADCVVIGAQFCNRDIDLVISGINYGPNIGKDINHSATVGGAREALMIGKPGIAVSINSFKPKHMYEIAELFATELERTYASILTTRYALNINYPDWTPKRIRGAKVTTASKLGWENQITFRTIKNYIEVSIKGVRPHIDGEPDTDWYWLRKGWVTITPIGATDVDYTYLEELRQLLGC